MRFTLGSGESDTGAKLWRALGSVLSKTFRLAGRVRRAAAGVRHFAVNTTGGVAAMVALLSPVIIGAMGLGAEVGYWYLIQRRVQNAADVSVHAAALRKVSGDDAAAYSAMATYIAEQAEIDFGEATIEVRSPPTAGAFTAIAGAVEVTIVQTVPRMFSAIYRNDPMMISGRSVAIADGGGAGCVIALSPTAQGAITVSGSAAISLTGCDMVSNAEETAFLMSGNGSSVAARCVQTVGTATPTSSLNVDCGRLRENAKPLADPYGDVPEPATTGLCLPQDVGANNTPTVLMPLEAHASGMSSMRFCNGLTMRGDVQLGPGLYIIEGGDFMVNANASITGDGVVFYLADGVELDFNGTADFDLSAPASGVYAGILIFGSRAASTASHKINGNAGMTIDGAIYTPASHLDVKGSAGTSANGCTQIIGGTVEFSGNDAISISCNNTPGNDAHTGRIVALVE